MKITKNYLNKIIKEEIQNLFEDKDADFANIITNVKIFLETGNNESLLKNLFYHYIVKDHRYLAYVEKITANIPLYQEIMKMWKTSKNNLINYAQTAKWGVSDNGYWLGFAKPGPKSEKIGNNKRYLTFEKITPDDPMLLLQENKINLNLLPHLLYNLATKPTKGKVSFKIHSNFLLTLQYLDNVVIHYKEKSDESLIEQAVKETNFRLDDRTQFDRVNNGVDTDESDSELVAKRCVENLKINANWFKANFEQSPDSPAYKQAVEFIKEMIKKVSLNSSHRN